MSDLGKWGEDRAKQFLSNKGFQIKYMNYETPVGECDIVAVDDDAVVFVEVKTRSSHQFGSPLSSITYEKREQLRRVARYYLSVHEESTVCRFDVIGITLQNREAKLNYIKGAFEGRE